MDTEDRTLVDAFVAHGDEEAFRHLFRRHTPRLYALAYRLMAGRAADAEDVIQDTWLRAARHLGTFEWRSSLSTWLTGIAINCARERLRRRTPEAVDPATLAAIVMAADAGVPDVDLERAIALLPDGYREVLVLHDVEGFTHAEIATRLGVSPGTSKSQLFHARRAVRARLSPTARWTEATDHD
ncbi:MAG: sigma-70 family RNA polymerase sigma factor [Vicinamibacterales bacterium]